METDWAENRATIPDGFIRNTLGKLLDVMYSTGERDKFRTRLERGTETGTTEIYISHRGMEEVYTSPQQGPDEVAAAAAGSRARSRDAAPASWCASACRKRRAKSASRQQPPTVPRADARKKAADGAALALNEQFDRAWRRVGLALDRVGFTVEDRDRSKGLYFVRYIDPESTTRAPSNKGLFSKLKFWGSSDDKEKQKEQYRILVKDAGDRAEVNVLNKDGGREQSADREPHPRAALRTTEVTEWSAIGEA